MELLTKQSREDGYEARHIGINESDLLISAKEYGGKVIDGLNNSVTSFHFVNWAKTRLDLEGFKPIAEKDVWMLESGKYYFLRNLSSIIVFTIGKKVNLKETSFAIIGGHTDSPTLRFAPNAYILDNTYEKFNLQTYGGGIWHSWFDRDLGLAGKISVMNPSVNKLETHLLKIDKPILFIPNLPIHLRTDKVGFKWNNETNLKAIISTNFFDDNSDQKPLTSIEKKLGRKLSQLISENIGFALENIYDYNLVLYDTNTAKFTGIQSEFISSERFDNLGTSITSILSIIENSRDSNTLASQDTINVLALFDSEEIGSMTYQGANSSFLKDDLLRIFSSVNSGDISFNNSSFQNYFSACCDRSFFVSCDMAHLFHPNYPEFYQKDHKPLPHLGPVIKTNAGGKYSTQAEGASLIKYIASQNKIPLQEFIVRQDIASGTTLGPIVEGQCGIRSVDIGCPQLAMHSIREQTAIVDLYYLGKLFVAYFLNYSSVSGSLFDQ